MRAATICIDVRGTADDIEQMRIIARVIENGLRVGLPLKSLMIIIGDSYQNPVKEPLT